VEYLVGWQAAIASKLAPTGTEYFCKISVGWQVAIASKLAPTGIEYICKISVRWQAAIASKLAPTEEQSKSRASRTTASLLTTHQAER
jgi:hypothetical protein